MLQRGMLEALTWIQIQDVVKNETSNRYIMLILKLYWSNSASAVRPLAYKAWSFLIQIRHSLTFTVQLMARPYLPVNGMSHGLVSRDVTFQSVRFIQLWKVKAIRIKTIY